MSDHYNAVREHWRGRFLEMNHEEIAEKFHLKIDAEYLYLIYFTHPFAVCRRTGRIVRLDKPGFESDFNIEVNFFNMFHYAVERPVPSRVLVPFRSVKRVYPFEAAYKKNTLAPFAKEYTHRAEALQHALDALKARRIPQGDAGGEIEILPGLRMAVTFWDADDEFPAQANMLFDSNITDYMHEENVVIVASDAVRFLREAAN